MALAAAQHGFYSATPPKWSGSRYARAQERGVKLPMPDYSAGEYLYTWLRELGFCSTPAPGFHVALNHKDLWPFFQLKGIAAEPWEVDTLVEASRRYISGYILGQSDISNSPMELEEQ